MTKLKGQELAIIGKRGLSARSSDKLKCTLLKVAEKNSAEPESVKYGDSAGHEMRVDDVVTVVSESGNICTVKIFALDPSDGDRHAKGYRALLDIVGGTMSFYERGKKVVPTE